MHRLTNDNPNSINVAWELTTTCNYSCWYCPDYLHNGKYKWPDLQSSLTFFNNLAKLKDIIHIDMAGGEPTLWPEINQFLINKPSNSVVEVSSNGSRSIKWWEKNFQCIDGVCLTFHPDTADINHFYNLCEVLEKYDNKVINIFIMATKSKLDVCRELYYRLLNSGFKLSVSSKVLEDRIKKQNDNTYIDNNNCQDVKDFLDLEFDRCRVSKYKSKPNQVYLDGVLFNHRLSPLNKTNNFYGWHCNVGINRLHIRANGDIYKATCRAGGIIGNINKNTSLIYDQTPVICKMARCGCLDEIKVEKTKID